MKVKVKKIPAARAETSEQEKIRTFGKMKPLFHRYLKKFSIVYALGK